MTKLTVATVNKELKRLGYSERLYRGDDYFYFADGNSHLWSEDSVYVAHAHELSLDQWVSEYERLKKQYDN